MLRRVAGKAVFWVVVSFQVSCGGLVEAGAIANITEQYQQGNGAELLNEVDTYTGFISDRPMLLAEAYLYKAKCLQRMSRRAEAIELYRYVSEQHSTTPFPYEARAMLSELGESEL